MAEITVGRTEAEGLDLNGYQIEQRSDASDGEGIRTSGTGIASGTFDGVAGRYRLTVNVFNGNDGSSNFNLRVNGQVVGQWAETGGQGGLGTIDTQTIELDLKPGDAIAIQGIRNLEEYARLDSLDLVLLEEADTPRPQATKPCWTSA